MTGIVHAVSMQGRLLSGYLLFLVIENNYIGLRINDSIGTSLQNMGNVTSAIDISIDNNDNEFR